MISSSYFSMTGADEINRRGPIVLMYHGTPPHRPTARYSLEARLFRRHLDLLQRRGWQTRTLGALLQPDPLPEKTVIITFDDGYADNFDGAFLPLRERDMVATWFITAGVVGGHASWLGAPGPETAMLASGQLREMAQQGMEIGSHTHTHPDLTTLSPRRQKEELARSKQSLEALLGREVDTFAYPYGRYDDDTLGAVRACGYRIACTVRPGWIRPGEGAYRVRRITLFSGDSEHTLARKLSFADNDVSWQRLFAYYRGRLLERLPGLAGNNK